MRTSTSAILLAVSAPLTALAAPIRRAASDNVLLVLKFANALEQLESQFYTQALAKFTDADFNTAGFAVPAVPKEQFSNILFDETTHTTVLASTLDSFGAAPLTCTFDFSSVLTDVATMAGTARLVENLGVSAYLGAAALIDDPQILNAAASILTVEARHQTILNLLLGGSTIPSAFDMVLSPPQVLSTAAQFITSGCDTGITPNPALAITNTGTVAPGTKLELSSKAVTDTTNITCQMLVGGAPFAIVLPYDNCVVPAGINGLVYIYAVNTDQPLLSNIQDQFQASIVAGPTGAFIDTQPEQISQVVLGKVSATSGGSSGSGSSSSNSGSSGSSSSAGVSSSISTTTISPEAASSVAASATATGSASSASPTSAPSNAAESAGAAALAALGGQPNMFTGDVGSVKVLGWSTTPK